MTAPVLSELKPAQAVTMAGEGTPVTIAAERSCALATVDVTALEDGESVTVTFETALTAAGGYRTVDTLVLTNKGQTELYLGTVSQRLRVLWALTGTTATFQVLALSHQVYCSPSDMEKLSIPAATLAKLTVPDRAFACIAATDEAVSYIGNKFDFPLVSWGNALRLHCANMAVYHGMRRRGFNPDADQLIRMGYLDALAWLKSAAGTDPSIVDQTPDVGSQAVYVVSDPPRGWQRW